jgi:hypothetical protein
VRAGDAVATWTRAACASLGLIGQVEAVTVAVPTELHRDIALPFLRAGIPVLVEKPIARSLLEADELIEAAADANVALGVGHTERFNPAVAAARPLLNDPRFIEVHRPARFPNGSASRLVFDLVIHDSTSCCRSSTRRRIAGSGRRARVDNRVDIANARPRFANGCIANLTASRISETACARSASSSRRPPVDRLRRSESPSGWLLTGAAPCVVGGKSRSRTKSRSARARRFCRRRRVAPGADGLARPAAARSPSRRRLPIRYGPGVTTCADSLQNVKAVIAQLGGPSQSRLRPGGHYVRQRTKVGLSFVSLVSLVLM